MTGDPPVTLDERRLATWGEAIGRQAAATGAFVALYGELGAGKSTLVRAACRGLGVIGSVPSPTFTLLNVHDTGETRIYHADLYRIDPDAGRSALVDAGWPELLEAEGPVFVEWAERAADWLPADRWDVRLGFVADPGLRSVSITRVGRSGPPPEPPAC